MDGDLPPPTEELVRRLFQLASTPFQLDAWRERWSEYGWLYEPSEFDDCGFTVHLPDDLFLVVSPIGHASIEGCLPFYFWEEFIPKFHKNPEDYVRQKKAYDDCFESASDLALKQLGEAFLRWTDADKNAHRAMAWEGSEGILVLQQATRDPQFGIEVDFWLARGRKSEFRPKTPLIDWLMNRS